MLGCGDFRPLSQLETVAVETPAKFAISEAFSPAVSCRRWMNRPTGMIVASLTRESLGSKKRHNNNRLGKQKNHLFSQNLPSPNRRIKSSNCSSEV